MSIPVTDVDRAVDPDHYRNAGLHSLCGKPIEVKDISGELPGFLSQAVQYILRAGKKDDVRQELRKAITFLQFELERLDKHDKHDLDTKLHPTENDLDYLKANAR